ncbi:MAG: hypothetical protein OXU61_02190 [Gammaproteobacteria bacterium]|nr:hypothetical protein [Gammaproteobacteria bacterium]
MSLSSKRDNRQTKKKYGERSSAPSARARLAAAISSQSLPPLMFRGVPPHRHFPSRDIPG